ncbi:MAG: NfeD family protein [Pseudomonadota bacterium]
MLPDIDPFAFLDGISPWWWVALGIALGAVEVLTGTTFLLGPMAAALAVAAVLLAYPELDGALQIGLFGAAMLVGTVIAWIFTRRARRRAAEGGGSALNRRGQAIEGRVAPISGPFEAGIGSVTVDGVVWRARLVDGRTSLPEGTTTLRIAGVDGATLLVEAPPDA